MSLSAAVGPLPSAACRTAVRERATRWWAGAVILSAFGPYIGSIRLEQAVVFGSAVWVLVTGWPRMLKARVPPPWPLILLAAIEAVICIGTLSRPFDPGFLGSQPTSHGLTYFLPPLALLIVTWYWTLSVAACDLAATVARVTVAVMSVNGMIAFAQLASGNITVLSFLPRFWGAVPVTREVAGTASAGRFTGIFSLPAEAGMAYGLGLFCVVFLAQRGTWHRVLLGCFAAVMIAGGVLSVSKVFLLGALPLAALMVLRGHGRTRVLLCAALGGAGFWLLAHAGVLPAWAGAAKVGGLLNPAVRIWGGGRYGAGGSLGVPAADVLHASPWYGFGASGLLVPYDSLWLEALVLAGLAGVVLTAALVAAVGWRWLALRSALGRPEWLLAGASLALAAGASAGLPSLTTDRAGTLLWLILGLLVCAAPSRRGPGKVRDYESEPVPLVAVRAG